jgi:hypothetical protein
MQNNNLGHHDSFQLGYGLNAKLIVNNRNNKQVPTYERLFNQNKNRKFFFFFFIKTMLFYFEFVDI